MGLDITTLRATAARIRRRFRRPAKPLPLHGWTPSPAAPSPTIDGLADAQLGELNALLPWACFTVDGRGRRVGAPAWSGKRDTPQVIPDPRIERMDEWFGLADKRVTELGCFEGVHTIALCQRAAHVLAVDARVSNVVKTIVRASLYGEHPDVAVVDLDEAEGLEGLACDVVHHVGVLYHLQDPVRHLVDLGKVAGGIWLDTHVARDEELDDDYEVEGRTYRVRRFHEGTDPFSGMRAFARWLTLADLQHVLGLAGFLNIEVLEVRAERNGRRVLVAARR